MDIDTTSRTIYDAETGDAIGPATEAQIEASDAAAERDGGYGGIWIDGDGDPVADQDARQSWIPQPVRRAYVEQG